MGLVRRSKDTISHFGILGQKWGLRRYQNEDGTLTEAGKSRYYKFGDVSKSAKNEKSSGIISRFGNNLSNHGAAGLYKTYQNSGKILGNKMNLTKETLKFAFMGKVGTEQYNMARSLGAGRVKSVLASIGGRVGNFVTLGRSGSRKAKSFGLYE